MYLQMSSLLKQEKSAALPQSSREAVWTTTSGTSLESGGDGDGDGQWRRLDSPKKWTLTSSNPSLHRRLPSPTSWRTAWWKSRTTSQGNVPTWSKTSKQRRCLIFLSEGESCCSKMWKYPIMKRSRVRPSWLTGTPSTGSRNCSGE